MMPGQLRYSPIFRTIVKIPTSGETGQKWGIRYEPFLNSTDGERQVCGSFSAPAL
jgi:hypothetical protein